MKSWVCIALAVVGAMASQVYDMCPLEESSELVTCAEPVSGSLVCEQRIYNGSCVSVDGVPHCRICDDCDYYEYETQLCSLREHEVDRDPQNCMQFGSYVMCSAPEVEE